MENKILGVLNCKYENRRTGKTGTLVDYDNVKKTLTFVADDGDVFTITQSQFRSNWRKCVCDTIYSSTESDTEKKSIDKCITADDMSENTKIVNWLEDVNKHRSVQIDFNGSDLYTIYIDDLESVTARIHEDENSINLSMLPDIFSYSKFTETQPINTIKFNDKKHMSVNFIVNNMKFTDVLQIIKQAVIDINLYGYLAV